MLGDRAQLAVDVLPLADAQVVEELRPAHPAEGGGGQLLLLVADVPPQVQEGQEVAALVPEAGVALVGLRLLVGGAFARVLDGQRGGDHHHLAHAAVAVGLQHHPGQPRVDRELRELAAHLSVSRCADPAAWASNAPSSSRSWTPALMLRLSGGSMKGNFAMSPRPAAVICRMTEARLVRRISGSVNSGRERKSSSSYSRTQMPSDVRPAAALALVGAGLADRLDRQPLHLGAVAVAGDAGGAGVDDVPDAGDGQGGLGDVGGQHDAAAAVRLEDAVLLGVGQPGVQRQDLGPCRVCGLPRAGFFSSASAVSRISRSPERKTRMSPGPSACSSSTASQIAVIWSRSGVLRILLQQRPVAHLHRIRAPADLDDRRVAEVPGEALRVDRRRGDDDLQVGAAGQQLGEIAEEEVDVEAALVRLVDDDRVVLAQLAVRWISASRMPSVISLTSVWPFTWSVKRTFQPTASPSGVPSSSATRSATVRAAIRRGWV